MLAACVGVIVFWKHTERDQLKALAAQGFAPMLGSAEDFDAFYRSEREKWGKVIKETGMDKD